MLKKINRNSIFLLVSDIVIIIIASLFSLIIKSDFYIYDELNLFKFENLLLLVLIKIFWFINYDLYRGMYRYTSIWDLIKLLKANLFSSASIFVFVTSFISELNYYFLSLVTLDFIFCSLLISLSRLSIRIYFSHYKSYSGFKKIKKTLLTF